MGYRNRRKHLFIIHYIGGILYTFFSIKIIYTYDDNLNVTGVYVIQGWYYSDIFLPAE